MPPPQSSGDDVDAASSSNMTIGYCYCGRRGEDYDDMIGCDNKDCPIEWFHYSCLKITQNDVPKGKYFCPECHKAKKTKK